MATAISLLPATESHHHLHSKKLQTFHLPISTSISKHSSLNFPKRHSNVDRLQPSLCASHSTDPSPASPSLTFTQLPSPPGRFLTTEELERVEFLENFTYQCELASGFLRIRAMRADELDPTSKLLAESFNETMIWPSGYATLLSFLVKNYLSERRSVSPHAITLLGFYRDESNGEIEEGEEELAGTVEVSFNKMGANASPPTPLAPKNCPYICNMTVNLPLRRRGIGWHLLKASEELISHMSSSREVYLHCRLIDTAPFNMYIKAGYEVVRTDSILVLLSLQRRKHLMRKVLPAAVDSLEANDLGSEEMSLDPNMTVGTNMFKVNFKGPISPFSEQNKLSEGVFGSWKIAGEKVGWKITTAFPSNLGAAKSFRSTFSPPTGHSKQSTNLILNPHLIPIPTSEPY